jgi:hypothetical protein
MEPATVPRRYYSLGRCRTQPVRTPVVTDSAVMPPPPPSVKELVRKNGHFVKVSGGQDLTGHFVHAKAIIERGPPELVISLSEAVDQESSRPLSVSPSCGPAMQSAAFQGSVSRALRHRSRLRRDAQRAAQVSHPCAVNVYLF